MFKLIAVLIGQHMKSLDNGSSFIVILITIVNSNDLLLSSIGREV